MNERLLWELVDYSMIKHQWKMKIPTINNLTIDIIIQFLFLKRNFNILITIMLEIHTADSYNVKFCLRSECLRKGGQIVIISQYKAQV